MSARRLCGSPAIVLTLLSIAMYGGCTTSSPPPTPPPQPPAANLNTGQAVKVLARDGDIAQVQTTDGKTGYVAASRLQAPSGSAESTGTEQVLTASTQLWTEKPATLPTEPPRPLDDIMHERDQVNALFVTADGKLTKFRPRGSGPFLDEATKQAFWLAYTCRNPACSQKDASGRPPVFALVPQKYSVGADGALIPDGPSPRFACPTCGQNETVRPYLPPESEKRMDELNAEHLRFIQQRDAQKAKPAP